MGEELGVSIQALVLDAEWDPRADYDLSEVERETKKAMDSAAIWKDPSMSVDERSRPTPDDEVLIRVRYAGVCGSDVSMIETDEEGYMHYSAYTHFPRR